ncbi:DUF6056 family protein [Streptomyces sp. NPDC059255]|uniref:DUF6056 family protein n=1 Tax=Streptomyces sp. NPDC059255 TaxID=3346793 RepID=UPI0036B9ED40
MATGASSVTLPGGPAGRSAPGTLPAPAPVPAPETGKSRSARGWAAYGPPALAALPLGVLAMAAWLGRHVRPSADDWCFLPEVRDHGITGLIGKFYGTDNGRLGNGLLVGLYAKPGVAGHRWFAAVSAVVMLAILWGAVRTLLRLTGRTAPRGVPLLVAAMTAVVFLFPTLNIYKTFYWPASSVSHTVAPVLACAAVIPLAWAHSRRGRRAALAAVFAVGAFLGTLSEETSAVAAVALAAGVLAHRGLFVPRVRPYARAWCLTGLAGVVTGLLVLVTSPGSRQRRERYGARTGDLFAPDALADSLGGFLDILGTVLTTWQYVGAVAAGLLLGLLVRDRGARPSVLGPCRPAHLLAGGALALVVSGYLCTVLTYPLFGDGVARAARTWNDYLLLYVALLTGAGALLGRALRRSGWRTGAATAVGAAVCAACCAGLAVPVGDLGQEMRVRAERWDHQDRWLRERAARGARVLPYHPLPISGMGEPFGDHGHRPWPARCVAAYHGLARVTFAPEGVP